MFIIPIKKLLKSLIKVTFLFIKFKEMFCIVYQILNKNIIYCKKKEKE